MINQQFLDRFPAPLPTAPESLLRKWADAHQDLFNQTDADIERIILSHQITEAEGTDLDEIGDRFGLVGRRRGREDEQYRAFLMSIVPAYAGNGTRSGMEFAISSGVQASPEDITITEHFDELEYSVTVGDWIRHRTTTIHELADLSDPSGVELRGPITYDYDATGVAHNAQGVRSGLVVTIPGAGVAHTAADSVLTNQRAGFGSGSFDGVDEFGDAV